MKKVKVTYLKTPWYTDFLFWVINSLSYKVKVEPKPMMHQVIEVDVTLANGRVGQVSFKDYFDIDQEEGKYTMNRTALKQYQERDNSGCLPVRFSQEDFDWQPFDYSEVILWGEPKTTTKEYAWRLYAVKIFGLTIRYESRLAKYCEE